MGRGGVAARARRRRAPCARRACARAAGDGGAAGDTDADAAGAAAKEGDEAGGDRAAGEAPAPPEGVMTSAADIPVVALLGLLSLSLSMSALGWTRASFSAGLLVAFLAFRRQQALKQKGDEGSAGES